MKTKLMSLTLGAVAASLAFTACEPAPTGTNTNKVVVNSNTAVVTNSNTNVAVTNTNSTVEMGNSNKWNSNITRADYEKDKTRWEKEAKDAGSSVGQGANDMWLWTKTRTALMTTNDLRESTVNVDVANDVVTLKGTVATAAQKTKAEEVAKAIDGVKSVKNELKVAANDSITNTNVNSMVNGNANVRK